MLKQILTNIMLISFNKFEPMLTNVIKCEIFLANINECWQILR